MAKKATRRRGTKAQPVPPLPDEFKANPQARIGDEPAEAFGAYLEFRGMGSKRSGRAISRRCGTSDATVTRWRREYHWDARAAQYDEAVAEAEREGVEYEALERGREHARRREEIEGKSWVLAEQLFEKVQAMIGFPLEVERTIRKDGEGRPTHVEIKPARWNMGHAATLAGTIFQLWGLSTGVSGSGGMDKETAQEFIRLVRQILDQHVPEDALEAVKADLDELGRKMEGMGG